MSVLNLQITSGTDDAADVAGAEYTTGAGNFNAGSYDASFVNYRSIGRFTSVALDNSENINSATLTLRANTSFTGTDCRTKLECLDADDAALPASTAAWDSAAKTTANADWDISTVWSVNSDYTSADFAGAVQEVVDRGGWASGQAIVVNWRNDSSPTSANNLRRAYSYNASSTYAPKLDIDYGGGGGAASIGTGLTRSKALNRMRLIA